MSQAGNLKASAGEGDVTAASNLANNTIIRGSGGAKGVKDSQVILDDSGNFSNTGTFDGRNVSSDGTKLDTYPSFTAKGEIVVGTGVDSSIALSAGLDGLYLKTDSAESSGLIWASASGAGDVSGPASSVDNTIVRFDSTTGKLIQNSSIVINDTWDISGINDLSLGGNITVTGTVDGRDIATDGSKLDGIEANADVTDATNVNAAGAVMNTDYLAKGDLLIASAASTPTVLAASTDGFVLTLDSLEITGCKWALPTNGDVVGPASSVDNTIVRFDSTTGKLIQNSSIVINDTWDISGINDLSLGGNITVTGTVDGRDIATDGSKLDGIEANADITDATNVNAAGAVMNTDYLAKGDLLIASAASTPTVLAASTDGFVLTLDSLEVTGCKWALPGNGDVTSAASLTDNAIVRGDGGSKGVQTSSLIIDDTNNLSGIVTLSLAGDITNYEATNDGNPEIRLGSADAEELHIQSVFDTGAQTLDYVLLQTDVASATANKGLFRFNVDGTDILDIDDGGIDLDTGKAISIAGTDVLTSNTLGSNVIASSLTSVGTITSGTWNGTDINVTDGGSGRGTSTAYAVICGGVTSTDPHQSIASVGTSGQVLTSNGAGALPTFQASSGGGMPEIVLGGTAASHQVNTTTAFPPINYRDFGSIEILTRTFDDTGPEYMQGILRVPADVDTSGTVTFEIIGSAATAAASKNVKFTFDFVQVADSGLMTGAYGSAQTWDDQAISATQDDQDIISNTQTVSTLSWTAGNMIYYRLYRSAATTNNLTGDYDVIAFNIRIPQA